MMIEEKELFGLNHYRYGEAYFGSCKGMRYRLAADPLKRLEPHEAPDGLRLIATVWPEPYAYARTPKEQCVSEYFPFTEDGMTDAVKWLNERYTTEEERWKAALEVPWTDGN